MPSIHSSPRATPGSNDIGSLARLRAYILEEAFKNALQLVVCSVILAWLLCYASNALLVNLPIAVVLVLSVRWMSLQLDIRPISQPRTPQRAHSTDPQQPFHRRKPRAVTFESEHSAVNSDEEDEDARGVGVSSGGGGSWFVRGAGAGAGGRAGKDTWRDKVHYNVVCFAWEKLCGSIIQQWVYDTWYGCLTADREFPAEIRNVMNTAFGELCHRARNLDAKSLILRDLSEILVRHIELYRSTVAAIGDWELAKMASTASRERALQHEMRANGRLHPALCTPDGHFKYLRAVAEGVLGHLLHGDPLMRSRRTRILMRELLAATVLRPVMMMCSPYQVNKGLLTILQASKLEAEHGSGDPNTSLARVLAEGIMEFERRAKQSEEDEAAHVLEIASRRQRQRQQVAADSHALGRHGQSHAVAQPALASSMPGGDGRGGKDVPHPSDASSEPHQLSQISGRDEAQKPARSWRHFHRTSQAAPSPTSRHQHSRSYDFADGNFGVDSCDEATTAEAAAAATRDGRSGGALSGVSSWHAGLDDSFDPPSSSLSASTSGQPAGAPRPGPPPRSSSSFSSSPAAPSAPPSSRQQQQQLQPQPQHCGPIAGPLVSNLEVQAWRAAKAAGTAGPAGAAAEGNWVAGPFGHPGGRGRYGFVGYPRASVVAPELTSSATEREHVVYKIRVADESGEWTVTRRYSHFEALHLQLRERREYRDLALMLPAKRIFVNNQDVKFVNKRRLELDVYVNDILQCSDLAVCQEVWQFLSAAAEGHEPSVTPTSSATHKHDTGGGIRGSSGATAPGAAAAAATAVAVPASREDAPPPQDCTGGSPSSTSSIEGTGGGALVVGRGVQSEGQPVAGQTAGGRGAATADSAVRHSDGSGVQEHTTAAVQGQVGLPASAEASTGAQQQQQQQQHPGAQLSGSHMSSSSQGERAAGLGASMDGSGLRDEESGITSKISTNLNSFGERLSNLGDNALGSAKNNFTRLGGLVRGVPIFGGPSSFIGEIKADLFGLRAGQAPGAVAAAAATPAVLATAAAAATTATGGAGKTDEKKLLVAAAIEQAAAAASAAPALAPAAQGAAPSISTPPAATHDADRGHGPAKPHAPPHPAAKPAPATPPHLPRGAGHQSPAPRGPSVPSVTDTSIPAAAADAAPSATPFRPATGGGGGGASRPVGVSGASEEETYLESAGLSGPLYDLVDAVFHLRSRGFFRRQVVGVARQMFSMVAGDAVDLYLMNLVRTLTSEHSIARALLNLQRTLWPGGTWYAWVVPPVPPAPPSPSGALATAKAALASTVGGDSSAAEASHHRNSLQNSSHAAAEPAPKPALVAMQAERYLESGPPPADADDVRAQALSALLNTSPPPALLRLVGQRTYWQSLQELFDMVQSSTFMLQLGYGALDTCLMALFPELRPLLAHLHQGVTAQQQRV